MADEDELWLLVAGSLVRRFEETNAQSSQCKPEAGDRCVGGYARVVTKVRELKEAKADLNPIYLNAGDNFQGTLWYNLFRWNATSYFLNMEPADAMVSTCPTVCCVSWMT